MTFTLLENRKEALSGLSSTGYLVMHEVCAREADPNTRAFPFRSVGLVTHMPLTIQGEKRCGWCHFLLSDLPDPQLSYLKPSWPD